MEKTDRKLEEVSRDYDAVKSSVKDKIESTKELIDVKLANTKELVTRTVDRIDKTSESVNKSIEKMKTDFIKQKAEWQKGREKLESQIGPLDMNGDGEVSLSEIKKIAGKNPDRWSDIYFWIQLILGYFGLTTARKGGMAALKKINGKKGEGQNV